MKKPRPFGKYFLLERINVGGMAEVFKAKSFGSDGFEKIVAIKRILPNIAEDIEFITMFIDEAKISVRLNHPNIAQVTDLNKVEDIYYIAMEYVHGKDIRTIFERCRSDRTPMTLAQACFLIMKVCEGLEYAHNIKTAKGEFVGLVHRDISPQNILISYEGDVKIIDFGIAKAAGKASKTQAGILKGKFGYMSPEQVRGLPLDNRSDIFSLGIVLYELLTGERLFVGESDFSTLEKVRNVEILPPSTYNRKIPEQLESIVLRALAKEVEDRYQSSGDFHDELQAFMYTSGEFYSRKDLSQWMKNIFTSELKEEKKKLEEYGKIKLPPGYKSNQPAFSTTPILDAPTLQPNMQANQANQGSSDGWWEDDEIETALYDKPEMDGFEEPALGDAEAQIFAQGPTTDEPLFSYDAASPTPQPNPAAQQVVPAVVEAAPFVTAPISASGHNNQKSGKGGIIIATLGACVVLASFLIWFFVFRTVASQNGTLIINPSPSDGVIIKLFDANNKPVKIPSSVPLKVDLSSGRYTVSISRKGYETIKKMVSLKASHTREENILLKQIKIIQDTFKLFISGEPKGATVWLNGREYAEKTPWTGMAIKAGSVKVEIGFGTQYHKYSIAYTKKPNENLNINYSLLPKSVAVSVRLATKKAKICIVSDFNAVPTKRQCRIRSNKPYMLHPEPGKQYYLKVLKKAFSSHIEKIDFTGRIAWSPKNIIRLTKPGNQYVANNNRTSPMDINIMSQYPMHMTPPVMVIRPMNYVMVMRPRPMVNKPASGSGTLRIGSKPRSIVFVDGSKKGWTPKRLSLSTGRHRITLINNDKGLRKSFSIKISAGKTVTKIIKF
jgi:eukaryotic-like serine/threonine-protein kinase